MLCFGIQIVVVLLLSSCCRLVRVSVTSKDDLPMVLCLVWFARRVQVGLCLIWFGLIHQVCSGRVGFIREK